MVEYGNVILCHGIGKIGGIETFFYELARKYKDYDPTDLVEVITLRTYEYNGAWSMGNQKKLINREEANELIKLGYVKELDT